MTFLTPDSSKGFASVPTGRGPRSCGRAAVPETLPVRTPSLVRTRGGAAVRVPRRRRDRCRSVAELRRDHHDVEDDPEDARADRDVSPHRVPAALPGLNQDVDAETDAEQRAAEEAEYGADDAEQRRAVLAPRDGTRRRARRRRWGRGGGVVSHKSSLLWECYWRQPGLAIRHRLPDMCFAER